MRPLLLSALERRIQMSISAIPFSGESCAATTAWWWRSSPLAGFSGRGCAFSSGCGGRPRRPDSPGQGRHRSIFPWGTLMVNVVGSAVFGDILATAMAGSHHDLELLAGIGSCGAFTTYSTFSYKTVRLAQKRARWTALATERVPQPSSPPPERCSSLHCGHSRNASSSDTLNAH